MKYIIEVTTGTKPNLLSKGLGFFIILFSFVFVLPSLALAQSATVPGAPTNVTATAGDFAATVSFTPPANNGGSPITSYTVTSNPGGITGTGTASPIIVSGCCGLINGTAYTFTVTATNSVGTGAASVASNSVTPLSMAPGAPTNVFAVAGNTQATVTFTAPASNGDPIGFYYYTVTSSPGGLTATGPGSGITVSGLTNGTAYTFTVTATNDGGPSAASVASNSVTPAVADFTSGLVGNWELNEGAGAVAHDSSGNGNNGTIVSTSTTPVTPVWVTGLAGGALSFDGVSNYIDVPNSASLNPTQGLTISALVKPIATSPSNYLTVTQKGSINYDVAIRQDQLILMYLTMSPTVRNWWIAWNQTNKNLFDGAWHHLVATYDGANQIIYIDGIIITHTPASGSLTPNTNDLIIGTGFQGLMEDVRMYNRALNQADVQALYSSYGPVHTSPVTYYISSSQGNDNNDGLTEATPWQNLDMIFQAESVPNKIAPGDSVLLKQGDTWEGQIPLDYLGQTGGSPITIGSYVGPNGTSLDPAPLIYGDGRYLTWEPVAGQPAGVYQANIGIGSSISSVYQNNTAYTQLSNALALTPGTWGLPYEPGMIWIYTSDGNTPNNIRVFRNATINMYAAKNIVVENLDIQETNMAVYTYISNSIDVKNINTLDTLGTALSYSHATNSTMENNNAGASGCTTLYFEYNGSNNTMRNNIIGGYTPIVSGITLPTNTCDHEAIGLMDGVGDIIERNTLLASSIDFYFENNSIIRYNKFLPQNPITNNGIWPDGTGLIIYGNIGGAIADIGNTGTQPILIFNNTIMGYVMTGAGGVTGPVVFKDNIVYNDIMYASSVNFSTGVDSDYNCFYNTGVNKFTYNGTTYTGVAAYQAASGLDAHSVYGNPLLNANYSTAASSPCRAKGVDVSSLISFPYVDYAGNPFLQGSNPPDIGAFEYIPETLTVATAGNGYGEIFSSDGVVNCGANLPPAPDTCSETVDIGTAVTLTATPASGSVFSGWSGGGCSGTGSCTVTMSAAQNVIANFAPSVVNGVCGTANQTYLYQTSSYGANTLCKSGTASPASVAFPAPGTKVTWACLGVNNGLNSTCSAKRNKTKLLKLL